MASIVELLNVSKRFGRILLIDKVSFDIEEGSLTTLIGPNGAGKTTIAKLILGLEKPSTGVIKVRPDLKISYIPQELEFNTNIPITVEQFVILLTSKTIKSADWQTFDIFSGFNNLKHRDISKLSGGQLQKLLLAIALLRKPDLLILDEPTKSLDVNSQQEFYRLIKDIRSNLGITIFMISHDLFTVMKNSDKVICLNHHVCCSGQPSDLTNNRDFINTLSEIGFYTHKHDHTH